MTEWISVEDRLPEKYEKILVVSGDWEGEEHDSEQVVDDVFIGVREEDGKWLNTGTPRPVFKIFKTTYDECNPDGLVKYWMPIPKLPEDNDE
jgi:hypothetical protein